MDNDEQKTHHEEIGIEPNGMTFIEHLEELRDRLVKSLYAVGVGFAICYYFSKELFAYLMLPLTEAMPEDSKIIFTGVAEAFFTYLKVGIIGGIFLASPVILYQLWRFISPGLHRHERLYAAPFVFFSTVFFVGGALFGYFVVFPYGFEFFMGFATEDITPMPSVREYLTFAGKLLIAFGLVFELPLLTFFLAKVGVIDRTLLARKRKYAIVIAFIASALLTPPDIITQLFMAGPIVILFELSVWIARIFGRPEDSAEEAEKN